MFSWARRPLGTGTLSFNGNAAKTRQEGRNGRKDPEVEAADEDETRIHVIVNWHEELERLMADARSR